MSMIKNLVAGAFLVASVTAAAAQTTVEDLTKQGYARLAVANEPPITEVKPDGTVTGGAVEIARATLKLMGVNDVTAVVSPFGGMIPGLQASRFDMITAGMFMRPERCQAILFSEPDICDAQGILTTKANAEKLKSYADIVSAGIKIGVIPGSHGQREARGHGPEEDERTEHAHPAALRDDEGDDEADGGHCGDGDAGHGPTVAA